MMTDFGQYSSHDPLGILLLFIIGMVVFKFWKAALTLGSIALIAWLVISPPEHISFTARNLVIIALTLVGDFVFMALLGHVIGEVFKPKNSETKLKDPR